MARTITNFLIGIGMDHSQFDKGMRDTERNLESLKTTVNTVSAGITAAFIGAGLKVDDLAKKTYDLNSSVYRLSAGSVYTMKLGGAFSALGGDAGEALNIMQKMDGALDDLRVRGQSGLFDQLSLAGMDTTDLSQATDGPDLLRRFVEQFSHLTDAQKRVAAETVGLSDSSFRLFSGGAKALDEQVSKAGDVLHITQELTNQQVAYTEEVLKSDQAMQGLWNTISSKMLPGMTQLRQYQTEFTQAADKWIQDNPEEAKAGITGAAVATGGAAVGATGAVLSKFGVPGARVLGAAGPVGFAAGSAIAAEPWIDKGLNSVFGDSEYFQNIRTAPTWSAFGRALIGQHEYEHDPDHEEPAPAPTRGYSPSLMWRDSDYGFQKDEDAERGNPYTNSAAYHPANYTNATDSHYERQADATARAFRGVPLKVENHVEAKLYMDSREIDTRIEKYSDQQNQRTIDDIRGGLDR